MGQKTRIEPMIKSNTPTFRQTTPDRTPKKFATRGNRRPSRNGARDIAKNDKVPSSSDEWVLPDGVVLPRTITPELLSQIDNKSMLLKFDKGSLQRVFQEYDHLATHRGHTIRNPQAYLMGILKKHLKSSSAGIREKNGPIRTQSTMSRDGSAAEVMKEDACSSHSSHDCEDMKSNGDDKEEPHDNSHHLELTDQVVHRLGLVVYRGYCSDLFQKDEILTKLSNLSESDALAAIDELLSYKGKIRNFDTFFLKILNRYLIEKGQTRKKLQKPNHLHGPVNGGSGRDHRHSPSHISEAELTIVKKALDATEKKLVKSERTFEEECARRNMKSQKQLDEAHEMIDKLKNEVEEKKHCLVSLEKKQQETQETLEEECAHRNMKSQEQLDEAHEMINKMKNEAEEKQHCLVSLEKKQQETQEKLLNVSENLIKLKDELITQLRVKNELDETAASESASRQEAEALMKQLHESITEEQSKRREAEEKVQQLKRAEQLRLSKEVQAVPVVPQSSLLKRLSESMTEERSKRKEAEEKINELMTDLEQSKQSSTET